MHRCHPTLPLLLLFLGCSEQRAAPARKADAPASRFVGSALERAPTAAAPADVTGTVAESIDAAGYTYLRLQTPRGDVWAAVKQTAVERGAQVTVGSGNWMEGFESRTLKRRFDRILFGSLVGPAAAGHGTPASRVAGAADRAAGAADPVQAPHAGVQSGGAALGQIKVDKAEGAQGRTVAEVYADRVKLASQPVAVRGKVVKFNAGILGRNWVHLRDGTGSAAQQDDDLTVTTDDAAAVGDVVLVRGTLVLDRDFGAGYRYAVLIEGAQLTK